jgi:hypothetical protein
LIVSGFSTSLALFSVALLQEKKTKEKVLTLRL